MAAPVLAPMPDGLVLGSGYTLRVTALDPTTGNLVAGVNVGLEVITATSSDPGGFLNAGDVPMPILIGAANF
jgi:hypothetical protein